MKPAGREASVEVTITVDDRPVAALAGQSVGAAMTSGGIIAWRKTRGAGRPRGLFCGIGVCFDCLLEIDGVPEQRACLVPVRAGMEVRTSWPSDSSQSGVESS